MHSIATIARPPHSCGPFVTPMSLKSTKWHTSIIFIAHTLSLSSFSLFFSLSWSSWLSWDTNFRSFSMDVIFSSTRWVSICFLRLFLIIFAAMEWNTSLLALLSKLGNSIDVIGSTNESNCSTISATRKSINHLTFKVFGAKLTQAMRSEVFFDIFFAFAAQQVQGEFFARLFLPIQNFGQSLEFLESFA